MDMAKMLGHGMGYATIAVMRLFLRARWIYFHISPRYVKFRLNSESHFQDTKRNCVVSDCHIVKVKKVK